MFDRWDFEELYKIIRNSNIAYLADNIITRLKFINDMTTDDIIAGQDINSYRDKFKQESIEVYLSLIELEKDTNIEKDNLDLSDKDTF